MVRRKELLFLGESTGEEGKWLPGTTELKELGRDRNGRQLPHPAFTLPCTRQRRMGWARGKASESGAFPGS